LLWVRVRGLCYVLSQFGSLDLTMRERVLYADAERWSRL